MTRKRAKQLKLVHERPLQGNFKEPREGKDHEGKIMNPIDTPVLSISAR